jgi:hypothetical protein
MSDRRPAETVAHLSDYLWWLLPGFLKKKDREASLVGALCAVWGGLLDDARTTLSETIPLMLVETATGDWLDRLARARRIFRGGGESDESLRTRVLAACTIKQKGGTLPGMIEGLTALGYGVEVLEPFEGTDKWSRFVVRLLTWDGIVQDQMIVFSAVRALKPAHAKAHYDSLLSPATWDDWELGDPEEALDSGGQLDDWLPTQGD